MPGFRVKISSGVFVIVVVVVSLSDIFFLSLEFDSLAFQFTIENSKNKHRNAGIV